MGKLIAMRKRQKYSAQEQRLEAALHLVVLLKNLGLPVEWVHREIKGLMQRAINYTNVNKGVDHRLSMDRDNQFFSD